MANPARKPARAAAAPAGADATPSNAVQSVGVAFTVLQELAAAPGAIGTSELARRLGETKARVHRHLSTLRALGLVQKDAETDGYRLGWKSFRLGTLLVENFGLRKLARRHLLRLHHDSGQTVALAMTEGAELTVLDAIQSTGDIAITIRPGSTIHALSSAVGRAVLAFQSDEVRAAALQAPVAARSSDTPQDAQRLARRLDTVRQRRYEVASGERLAGVAALACPLFDDRNEVIGSIALIGSADEIREPVPPALLRPVQDAARRISQELGSTAWNQVEVQPPRKSAS